MTKEEQRVYNREYMKEYRKTEVYKAKKKRYRIRHRAEINAREAKRMKAKRLAIRLSNPVKEVLTPRERYEKNYAKKKFEWQTIIISKGMDKCWKCGYDKYFGAIDFHHINNDRNGSKKELMGNIFNQNPTPERIKILEKCIPLCARCHRELHIEERSLGVPTGHKKQATKEGFVSDINFIQNKKGC